MAGWSVPFPNGAVPICATFDSAHNTLWFGTADGEIGSYRIFDGQLTMLGGGYSQPVAVLLAVDGLSLYLLQANGDLFAMLKTNADRLQAALLVSLGEAVVGAALHPDEATGLVLTGGGAVVSVDFATGTFSNLADGFTMPVGISVDSATRLCVVHDQIPAGHVLVPMDCDSGAREPAIAAPQDTSAVLAAPLDGTASALCAYGPSGNLELTPFGGQPPVAGDPIGARVLALARWGSLVLMCTHDSIEASDWALESGPLSIAATHGPLYVGGYARADIDLAGAGLTQDELTFAIEEPNGGFVSAATEPDGAAGQHRFVFTAGAHPGEYHLIVRRVIDASLVARHRYRVTAHWPDDDNGPAVVVTGRQQLFARGSWGGGVAGPENINTVPAPEAWRVLVVLVNLKERGFGASLAATQTTWRDFMIGPRSVKAFYEEASRFSTPGPAQPRGTTMDLVSGSVQGPVSIDIGWGDAFTAKNMSDTWAGWDPKPTFWQDCATAVCAKLQDDGLAETLLRQADAVVFVVRTASSTNVMWGGKPFPALYVWPQAASATFWWKTALSTSFIRKPAVFMPDIQPSAIPSPNFDFDEAVSHELGHTLGLEDLYDAPAEYPAEIMARGTKELDHMSSNGAWPSFSLPNKMRLGWIAPHWIEKFDFGQDPTGHAVTLHAMEALDRNGPPGGRKVGIEIRIRDGWSYYFEYRRTQAGQIGDQLLAATDGNSRIIVGTDVNPDGAALPARPPILRLAADADGNGPVLDTGGEDYEETDVTSPTRLHDFRLVLDQIDPVDQNAAHVRVEYVRAHRPELQISPAPGRGNWKSPDIDLIGPQGSNRVAKGLHHTVVARVSNKGSLAAQNVRVSFNWMPFTTAPGSFTPLADPPRKDVAAGTTETFETGWDVPADLKVADIQVEHFCVRVAVEAFVDPLDPNHNEIVVGNNWAQSNFDSTNVSHGSPSERRWTGLTLTNQLDVPAVYLTEPEQDSDHFRAYIANAWLRIGPHETRMVEIAYESLAGDPAYGGEFDRAFNEGGFELPAHLSFTSFLLPPMAPGCAAPKVQWGAGLDLRPGQRTQIERFDNEGEAVRGRVYGSLDDVFQEVTEGNVNVVFWAESSPSDQLQSAAQLNANGGFIAIVPQPMMAARNRERVYCEALYLGSLRWSPCRSGAIALG